MLGDHARNIALLVAIVAVTQRAHAVNSGVCPQEYVDACSYLVTEEAGNDRIKYYCAYDDGETVSFPVDSPPAGTELNYRCQAQRGDAVIPDPLVGEILYTPRPTEAGCDLLTFEYLQVSTDEITDLRYRDSGIIIVHIVNLNDPPDVPSHRYYYDPETDVISPNAYVEFADYEANKDALPSDGDSFQRLRRQLDPESGFDVDGEIVRYVITRQPSNGTVWFDDHATEVYGTNNYFNYAPFGGLSTVDDGFQYQADDCSSPKATIGACSTVTGSVHVRVGTTGNEQGSSEAPPSPGVAGDDVTLTVVLWGYSYSTPLVVQEDIAETGTINRYELYDADGFVLEVPDLQYYFYSPSDNSECIENCRLSWGTVSMLCNGYESPGLVAGFESCDKSTGLDSTGTDDYGYGYDYAVSTSDNYVKFTYTPNANVGDQSDFFLVRARSASMTTLGSQSSTMYLQLQAVDDKPIFTEIAQTVESPMAAESNPQYGEFTLTAVDIDSPQVWLMARGISNSSLERGVLYTAVDDDGQGTLELSPGVPMPMNNTGGNEFSITLYYQSEALEYGENYLQLEFEALDTIDTVTTGNSVHAATINVHCIAGYYISTSHLNGGLSGQCAACSPGTYSREISSEYCVACAAGTYTASIGSAQCSSCPEDTYQASTGSTSCESCPVVVTGFLTAVTLGTGSNEVEDCMCARKVANESVTSAAGRGFYGQNGTSCNVCPGPDNEGGEWVKCPKDGMRWPMNLEGYYVDTRQEPVEVRMCFPEEACPEAATWEEMVAKPCKSGYSGIGCAECSSDYFRYFGECKKCDGALGFPVKIIIAMLVYMVILSALAGSENGNPMLQIFVNYMQMLGILASYNLKWTDKLKDNVRLVAFFNIHLEQFAPECSNDDWSYEQTWVMIMLTPVILGLCIFARVILVVLHQGFTSTLGAALKSAFPSLANPPQKNTSPFNSVQRAISKLLTYTMSRKKFVAKLKFAVHQLVVLLNFSYAALSVAAWKYFACPESITDGNYYLQAEPNIRCYHFDDSNTWTKMFFPGIFATIIYVFGIPALLASLLYFVRNNLEGTNALAMLGALYQRFDKDLYMWEVCVLLTKMGLCLPIVLFINSSDIFALRQGVMAMAVIVLAMFTTASNNPFDTWVLNQFQLLCYASLFFLLYAGCILTGYIGEDWEAALTGMMVITINIPVAIFLLAHFRWAKRTTVRVYTFTSALLGRCFGGGGDEKAKKAEELQLSWVTSVRLLLFVKKLAVHRYARELLTATTIRLTKEQWHSKDTRIPDRATLRSMLDAFWRDGVIADSEFSLQAPKTSENFEDAFKQKTRTLETLAKHPVEQNLPVKEFLCNVMNSADELLKKGTWGALESLFYKTVVRKKEKAMQRRRGSVFTATNRRKKVETENARMRAASLDPTRTSKKSNSPDADSHPDCKTS
ncbi:hypothetical protein CYMTET_36462 [Cymbomonas tetramitiformis]|uniref:Tyrosine-protein kinase ephrin type A/B receptor-like domain-containing protein n=1 Tax=Cymbomonas tetramitiformis TaxID=36881 RepID=A0AAE0CFW9_9CHLO|nr:hypothetical protein CYMTET_36462 [Cymbomonas tetramitiformis]